MIMRSRIFRVRNSGFTFAELMIVIILLALCLGTLFRILREGIGTSAKGAVSADTILEARRILEMVRGDLKMQCFPIDAQGGMTVNFQDLVEFRGTPPLVSCSFLAFSRRGTKDESVPPSVNGAGTSNRRASRIEYSLQPTPGDALQCKTLTRLEGFHPAHPLWNQFPGGTHRDVLSTRVNFFSITPFAIVSNGTRLGCYLITLQVVATAHGLGLLPDTPRLVVDFYDLVYPRFYNGFANAPGHNRNWHAGVQGPPAPSGSGF